MSNQQSMVDMYTQSVFGSSAPTVSDGADLVEYRRIYNTLLEEITDYRLGMERELRRERISVLREQVRAATELNDARAAVMRIRADDLDSQRAYVEGLYDIADRSQADLNAAHANYNRTVIRDANTASRRATAGGNEGREEAAWNAVSESLLDRTRDPLASDALPGTVKAMLQRHGRYIFRNGWNYDEETGRFTDASGGALVASTGDSVLNGSINDIIGQANEIGENRAIRQGQVNAAREALRTEMRAYEADQSRGFDGVSDRATQYLDSVLSLNQLQGSAVDRMEREIAEQGEDSWLTDRERELAYVSQQLFGVTSSDSGTTMEAQAIKRMIDSGWAEAHGIDVQSLGQVIDTNGDGKVDQYFPGPGDRRALNQFAREYRRTGGDYGLLQNGRTGTVVEVQMRPSEEGIALLQHNEQFYYRMSGDTRVVLTADQARDVIASTGARNEVLTVRESEGPPPVFNQYFIDRQSGQVFLAQDITSNPNLQLVTDPDLEALRGQAVATSYSSATLRSGLGYEEAKAADFGLDPNDSQVTLTDLGVVTSTEVPLTSELTEDMLVTVQDELMIPHAADMPQDPPRSGNGIRLRSLGFINEENIVGEPRAVARPDKSEKRGTLGAESLFRRFFSRITQEDAATRMATVEGVDTPVRRAYNGIVIRDYTPAEQPLAANPPIVLLDPSRMTMLRGDEAPRLGPGTLESNLAQTMWEAIGQAETTGEPSSTNVLAPTDVAPTDVAPTDVAPTDVAPTDDRTRLQRLREALGFTPEPGQPVSRMGRAQNEAAVATTYRALLDTRRRYIAGEVDEGVLKIAFNEAQEAVQRLPQDSQLRQRREFVSLNSDMTADQYLESLGTPAPVEEAPAPVEEAPAPVEEAPAPVEEEAAFEFTETPRTLPSGELVIDWNDADGNVYRYNTDTKEYSYQEGGEGDFVVQEDAGGIEAIKGSFLGDVKPWDEDPAVTEPDPFTGTEVDLAQIEREDQEALEDFEGIREDIRTRPGVPARYSREEQLQRALRARESAAAPPAPEGPGVQPPGGDIVPSASTEEPAAAAPIGPQPPREEFTLPESQIPARFRIDGPEVTERAPRLEYRPEGLPGFKPQVDPQQAVRRASLSQRADEIEAERAAEEAADFEEFERILAEMPETPPPLDPESEEWYLKHGFSPDLDSPEEEEEEVSRFRNWLQNRGSLGQRLNDKGRGQ